MFEGKSELILDEGVPVTVTDIDGTLLHTTTALWGKATKQFFSEISFEYHRSAVFIPEIVIGNGMYVNNSATSEIGLILANMPEVVQGVVLSRIARMVETNNAINVDTLVETADKDGNVTVVPQDVVSNLRVYVERVSGALTQFKPGLVEMVDYRIYAPAFDLAVLDKLYINSNGNLVPMKVETLDYISFQGLVIITACTDTRT